MSVHLPLPPPDATVKTTCCEYCPVGCGYKAYRWPVGSDGGPRAHQNALGRSFPLEEPEAGWPTPNMHRVVEHEGSPHNVLIVPDYDATVVNPRGVHSVRGGALAQKLYAAEGPTSDRLLYPMLRVNGTLERIDWDLATDIVASVSQHVLDTEGPLAWGMKRYSYGGHENVTAITKLAFRAIGSPNHAPHHAPAVGDDVPGLSDAGIDAFGAAFEDDTAADVILLAGSDPYETKTVRFLQWMVPGGATLIYVDPRRTFTAAFAERKGGMHLQLRIGTDTALYGAIARHIVEQGWADDDFITGFTASAAEIAAESKWRRRRFGLSFPDFRDYLLAEPAFALDEAANITGVSRARIEMAAEILSGGGAGVPRTSILFEKGVYWSHNYENTAAIGNLGVLLGATGRPGRMTARLGGHQRGGQGSGGYPLAMSPHEFEGEKIEMDQDRWVVEGRTRFLWAIGVDWIGASACSSGIEGALTRQVREAAPVTSAASAIAELNARVDAGGMVFVHQEIYPNATTEFADLVLPAAGWGERDFARHNAERRLRLYQKIVEPPGEAREDWQIVAEVARKMGFEGFDWPDTNALFEESAGYSTGSRRDYAELAEEARITGARAHDLLASLGTTGIQTPIRRVDGAMVGTARLHADLRFKTDSGKANFVRADWPTVAARNDALAPTGDELWVTNMRVNHLWNNLSDFTRRPYAIQRWPSNILEMHPDDATARGIENGDLVRIDNDAVLDQVGGTIAAGFEAVALVSDQVPPGLTCTYFLYPGSYANRVVPGDTSLQPMSARYMFKLGRGRITRTGRWEGPPFPLVPRNLAGMEP